MAEKNTTGQAAVGDKPQTDVKAEAASVKSAVLELAADWKRDDAIMAEARERQAARKVAAAELRDATIALASGQGRSHLGQAVMFSVPTTTGTKRDSMTVLQVCDLLSGDAAKLTTLRKGRIIG